MTGRRRLSGAQLRATGLHLLLFLYNGLTLAAARSFTRRYAHREVTPVPRINSSGQVRCLRACSAACPVLTAEPLLCISQLCSLGFYSQSGTDLANMSVGSMLYPSVGWTM